jgi:hypothetical protein
VPKVMSRLDVNAQRWVQLRVVSLSDPLLYPVGTLAHGNCGDYFLFHSQCSEHPVKVDGGGFEENCTWTAVVWRADRACCADTSGLRLGEGESKRHDCYDPCHAALHCLCPRAVGFRVLLGVGRFRVEEGAGGGRRGALVLMTTVNGCLDLGL